MSSINRSHITILVSVLLCAISAMGAPGLLYLPDIETTPIALTASDTLLKPDSAASVMRRTLISEVDSDSLAAASLPLYTPRPKQKIQRRKVDIDNIVNFTAADSMIMQGQNSAFMYGDAHVEYGDMQLSAAEIKMDMDNSNVTAVGAPDSTGKLQNTPVFTDKSGEYESETMTYNFKSERGFITNVITEQGEGYITGGQTKKMENGEYYMQNGRYSTCSDHEHPHFYFQLTKAKVKPKSNVVSGPAYMVLAGLPLPLAVPFGYFPFSEKYSSGIIFPTFGDDYNRGFYLSNGGYYFAINDNVDLALTGEIYTKGSWGLTAQSSYAKRYKYSGSFHMSYLNTIYGEKGNPDYSKQTNFQLRWSHMQDAKFNPNMSLSASVNFTTSGYTRNDLNSYYSPSFTENTKSSTVNMTYRVPNSKWSFSTTASISQRTSDSTMAVSFPNVTVTLSQVYPFKRKRSSGRERWYEKVKLSYTGVFQNSLTAKQDVFFQKSLIKDWRNAMKHSIPISATFSLFKYINVTPSIRLDDRMYTNKIRRQWDPNASMEVCDTTYGFYNVWDFSASLSLDTKIYGFFQPAKFWGNKVKMIRHVLTPSVSISGNPDFSSPFFGYYGNYQYYNSNGELIKRKYSYFANSLYGVPGQGKSGTVSVQLANNVEMKVNSNDSIGEKKISLIENFTVGQSYNFAADSLNWSNINTSLLLRLTKNFNLNLNATWDVYTYGLSSSGTPVRVNKTRLEAGKGLGRLSSTGTSFSYTFNNNTFKRNKKKKEEKKEEVNDEGYEVDYSDGRKPKGRSDEDDMQFSRDGYMEWSIPWSLSVNYSVNYGYGSFNYKKMEYNGRLTQNLSFSGSIQPTKNWNFGFSTSYNFDTHKIAYMNCNVSRDLHCFTMTANFVPVGPYKSYNFHISVKSSMLQDLKYDKRSSYSNGVTWY
ncbi:MAG: LPS-assembly protein LptD [Muribaculum sp.]|nr:LPS-assembly protein LptD [Muribaculaceae bacterium]MCM1081336.1 LPS-assembly protein LptD [Muribaculum sp.]